MSNWLLRLVLKFASQGFGHLPPFAAKTPTWASLKYSDYVKEGYQSLIWVYRCVREIAEAISSVPWKAFKITEDGTRIPVPNHPLERLLRRPNDVMSGPAFFESWAIFFLLSGNSFVEIVRKGDNNDQGDVLALFPLRPDYMKVIPDPDNFVDGYIMDVQGHKIPFRRDEIIHWKLMDPLNDHRGMSPLMAGARIIDTENSAIGWNKVMLENAAQPSGARAPDRRATGSHPSDPGAAAESRGRAGGSARRPRPVHHPGVRGHARGLRPLGHLVGLCGATRL